MAVPVGTLVAALEPVLLADSPEYADVAAAVALAQPGDTVIVPAGTATWASTLTLTRGIRLVGSGNPTIVGKRVLIDWNPDATAQAAHETVAVEGFTFDGNYCTGTEVENSGIIRARTTAAGYVYFVVKNNTIKNGVNGQGTPRAISVRGAVWGVASGNTITQMPAFFEALGRDYDSWSAWSTDPGTADCFYFEDNLINFTADLAGYSGWTESGQGGRVVVRYNTWDYANVTSHDELWDMHGLNPPCDEYGMYTVYGAILAEYYGNAIVNVPADQRYRWMNHRGGHLWMFYNRVTGGGYPPNRVTQYSAASSGQLLPPCNENAQTIEPVMYDQMPHGYYWRNLASTTEQAFTIAENGCPSHQMAENVDFFNYNASFNGSAGIGVGPLASRPAGSTVGAGYWATDQSASDLTGLIGRNPATPLAGTLYVYTADGWAVGYTPYEYPHPLAVGA